MASSDLQIVDGRPWFPTFAHFIEAGQVTVVDDYDGINADLYDHQRGDTTPELTYYRAQITRFGGRVLELGCGTGALTLPLVAAGAQVVGVDNSPAMVAHLQNRDPKVAVEVADMVDYVEQTQAVFDLILIPYNALVHVLSTDRQQRLMQGIGRILRRGGAVIVDSWLPRRRGRRLRPLWQTLSAAEGGALGGGIVYSEQAFPEPGRRVANLLTIPANGEPPFVTSIIEHVFTRAELRSLLRGAGFHIRALATDHPLIDGAAERFILEGVLP